MQAKPAIFLVQIFGLRGFPREPLADIATNPIIQHGTMSNVAKTMTAMALVVNVPVRPEKIYLSHILSEMIRGEATVDCSRSESRCQTTISAENRADQKFAWFRDTSQLVVSNDQFRA